MSIVCATDFSAEADTALRATAAIANATGEEEVWLVHSLSGAPSVDGRTFADERTSAERSLQMGVERCTALMASKSGEKGGRGAHSTLVYGPAAPSIAEFASTRPAATLVVNAHHAAHGSSRSLGEVAERLALATKSPMLVIRSAEPFEAWARGDRPLKILLAVDDTSSWEAAAAWVEQLRTHRPCDVTIAHLYYANEERERRGLPPLHRIVGPDPEIETLIVRDLEHQGISLAGEGKMTLCAVRAIGRMGDHLIELSRDLGVDLLALGTHQRRGLARFTSVSAVALEYAEASVLVAPASLTTLRSVRPPRTIFVPTDLSPASNRAIPHAFALVDGRRDAEIIIFHVASPGEPAREARRLIEAAIVNHRDAGARMKRADQTEPAEQASIRIEVVVSEEDPARVICDAVDGFRADVVCMSSHGRGGVPRAVLGSVADRVFRKVRRPVYIVRPPPA